MSAPILALAALLLSLSQPSQAAPKFLLVETLDDQKDANEAGKANTENDLERNGMDEQKDEIEDEDDETKAEKDSKEAGQGEDYFFHCIFFWLCGR